MQRTQGLAVLAANIAAVAQPAQGLFAAADPVPAPAPVAVVENPVDAVRMVMARTTADDEMDEVPANPTPSPIQVMGRIAMAEAPAQVALAEEMDELPVSVQIAQALTQPGGVQLAQGADAPADDGDPLESMNRTIFAFNQFLQDALFRPLAEVYLILPEAVRDSVRDVLNNLRSPVVLANDLLQGEGNRALVTAERFVINSTVGFLGLFDAAENMGIKGHNEDFGQTLAVWGMPEGFYLVLPILGPSNPRDAIARLADFYLDPVSQWTSNTDRDAITYARTLVSGIDSFSRVVDDLEKLEKTSIDFYAAVRSITRQRRAAQIKNGKPAEGAPLPNIQYEFNAELDPAK
jgi:phospholipid-binding lipoprotein MlaA